LAEEDARATETDHDDDADSWDAVRQLAHAAREARQRGDFALATALENEWFRRRARLLRAGE